MRKIFFILCFSFTITSCEKYRQDQRYDDVYGSVKYEVTCSYTPFSLHYDNEYGNEVELVSNQSSWEKTVDIDKGELIGLGMSLTGHAPTGTEAYVTLKISYRENVLTSFAGNCRYEYINCFVE